MNNEFTMRFALEKDIRVVLDLIKELSVYEKLEDQVVATEGLLKEWIFTKQKAEVILAELDGIPIGYALFFYNFSTFQGRSGIYLEDIYIRPENRGNGYGKALFKKVASLTVERKCGRMEWFVLDWNKPSIDFYLSMGAKPMDGWTIYRLEGETLDNAAK